MACSEMEMEREAETEAETELPAGSPSFTAMLVALAEAVITAAHTWWSGGQSGAPSWPPPPEPSPFRSRAAAGPAIPRCQACPSSSATIASPAATTPRAKDRVQHPSPPSLLWAQREHNDFASSAVKPPASASVEGSPIWVTLRLG